MAGPGDEMVAGAVGHGRMRASHADREQVIDTLKTAFVQDRLTRDELDARTGRALAARTYADLAVLTADIPPVPARRRSLPGPVIAVGICLLIAAAAIAAMWVASVADPGDPDPSWGGAMVALVACAGWAAIGIVGYAVFTAWDERSSRGQLPPRPGGHALEADQRSGTDHGPVPPGPRAGQTRTDPRSYSSRPHWSPSSGRGVQAPHDIRPVPDAL